MLLKNYVDVHFFILNWLSIPISEANISLIQNFNFTSLDCLTWSFSNPLGFSQKYTDTSVFYNYWYLFSILQIEYWYYQYFSTWKSYWILNTSIFILYWSGLYPLVPRNSFRNILARVQGTFYFNQNLFTPIYRSRTFFVDTYLGLLLTYFHIQTHYFSWKQNVFSRQNQ